MYNYQRTDRFVCILVPQTSLAAPLKSLEYDILILLIA